MDKIQVFQFKNRCYPKRRRGHLQISSRSLCIDEVEEFFETPHQVDIVRLGELHGFKVFEADNEITLKECISSFFQPAEKPYLLVVKTPRTVNGNILKEYFKHLSKRN